MFDTYCQWAANNPTFAWAFFVAFMIALTALIVFWPRKPKIDETDSAGC